MDKSGQSATIDTGIVTEGGLSRADSWQEQRSLTAPMRRVKGGRISSLPVHHHDRALRTDL
jgi:hypothetical protein